MARRISAMVAMLAVVGLLVWAGVYNYRARKAEMERAREAHITLTKDGSGGTASMDSSDMPSVLGKDLRGKPAPVFTLSRLDGGKFSSSAWKGHPVVVNFWATYCGPCKLEMPWFQEFSQKYAAQGLQVVGIDDEEGASKDDIHTAVKKTGVTYPILVADSSVESAFGIGDYLPVTYYIDATGKVVTQTPGAPSKDQIEANIQKILSATGGM